MNHIAGLHLRIGNECSNYRVHFFYKIKIASGMRASAITGFTTSVYFFINDS